MMKHCFGRTIYNASAVPEEDLNHWIDLREGGPPVLLVLGPIDEVPLFFVFLFPLTLKGERSTVRMASGDSSGTL